MRIKNKLYNVSLSLKQVESLSEIAVAQKTLSRSGTTTGLPSWRVLISTIADGTLVVSPRGESKERKPKKERKPFMPHPRFSPRWWTPDDAGCSMPTAAAVAASGYTVDELIAGGMQATPDGDQLFPADHWSGWTGGGK